MARELIVEIADWEGEVWRGPAHFVTAPTTEGSVGVLPGHEPLLAILREGEVKAEPRDSKEPLARVMVSGGFLSVDSDLVTVVADEARLITSAG
ncbi:MAG: F0F1 ATP synthase subunit epsilon [Bifidobacteriaceae bacterium]|jgi:F-type H+-transporting ATPase subunit epsilon|nr:F0F1 ATP synthase subunit epsilon [Bifidobacteriaceae bacterium]